MAVTAAELKEYLRLPQDHLSVTGDATIDRAAFIAAVKKSGLYVFIKNGDGWLLDGASVVLENYGITPGEGVEEISIDCVAYNVDSYLAAAKSKARSADIPVFENNAQYDLFIMALAAMYYDNRGMSFEGQRSDYSEPAARNIINSFVNELRYAKEDES
jgi:hypothetical protein